MIFESPRQKSREAASRGGLGFYPRIFQGSLLPGLLSLLGLLACGEAPGSLEREVPAGQQREAGAETGSKAIQEEFEAICKTLRSGEERFYGERPRRSLEARLESGLLSPEETLVAHSLLGAELLEAGRPLEALGELETAYTLARQQPVVGTFREEILGRMAVAHLQAAEDANCLAHAAPESCILPIREGGFHRDAGHGRKAGDLYLRFLEAVPGSTVAAWLLNVSRMVTGDFPEGVPPALRVPEKLARKNPEAPRWRDRGRDLGVAAVDLAGGAILDDFDGDGFLDLVSSTADPCDSLKAFRGDGEGGFEDVTRPWGLDVQLGGLNLIHGDMDGDGALDLLVLRGAWMFEHGKVRNSLLRNEISAGRGFRDVTRESGLGHEAEPTQTAAWADYDGDGDLDLYIGNEAQPPRLAPSRLYRNDGRGSFEDVTEPAGVANLRFAKAVTWGDYDDDGDPDLYVSNIGPNRLYRNGGDGTFEDVAPELGVTEPETKSFASWFFDFDNDGDLDLFVADYNGPLSRVVGPYFGQSFEEGQPLHLPQRRGATSPRSPGAWPCSGPSCPWGPISATSTTMAGWISTSAPGTRSSKARFPTRCFATARAASSWT